MRQVTGSAGKLERGFAIGSIVAAILVGAALYFLYPSSFNNMYGGTSRGQGQSQAGSSQYGGLASAPASSPSSGSTPEEVAVALVPEVVATSPSFLINNKTNRQLLSILASDGNRDRARQVPAGHFHSISR